MTTVGTTLIAVWTTFHRIVAIFHTCPAFLKHVFNGSTFVSTRASPTGQMILEAVILVSQTLSIPAILGSSAAIPHTRAARAIDTNARVA